MNKQTRLIDHTNLDSYLQELVRAQKTCMLQVRTQFRSGIICVQTGLLLNARTSRLKNEAAITEMLSWSNPSLLVSGLSKQFKRQITASLDQLLARAGKTQEHSPTSLPKNRPVQRPVPRPEAKQPDHATFQRPPVEQKSSTINNTPTLAIKPSLRPRIDIIHVALQTALHDKDGSRTESILDESIRKWATLGPLSKRELPALADILLRTIPADKKRQFYEDIEDTFLGIR